MERTPLLRWESVFSLTHGHPWTRTWLSSLPVSNHFSSSLLHKHQISINFLNIENLQSYTELQKRICWIPIYSFSKFKNYQNLPHCFIHLPPPFFFEVFQSKNHWHHVIWSLHMSAYIFKCKFIFFWNHNVLIAPSQLLCISWYHLTQVNIQLSQKFLTTDGLMEWGSKQCDTFFISLKPLLL